MNCLSGKLHTAVRAFTPSFGRLAAQASRLEGGRTLQTAGAGDFCAQDNRAGSTARPGRMAKVLHGRSGGERAGNIGTASAQPLFPACEYPHALSALWRGYEPSAFYLRRMEQLLERRPRRRTASCRRLKPGANALRAGA